MPDPANHKACRILDWNDLPADVRPAPGDLSNHVTFTNDEEFCRIDNSEFVISPEANGAPGGGHEAVEIVGTGEPPGCQIVAFTHRGDSSPYRLTCGLHFSRTEWE